MMKFWVWRKERRVPYKTPAEARSLPPGPSEDTPQGAAGACHSDKVAVPGSTPGAETISGPVVQRREHRFPKPDVAGPSPAGSSMLTADSAALRLDAARDRMTEAAVEYAAAVAEYNAAYRDVRKPLV